MKQIWKFPVLVKGVPKSVKEERICLLGSEAEFEIREVQAHEIQIVLSTQMAGSEDQEDGSDYALIEGQFYRRNRDPFNDEIIENERKFEDLLSYGHTEIYKPVSDKIMNILNRNYKSAWPPIARRGRDKGCVEELGKAKIAMDAQAESQIAYWREMMQERLDTIRLSDGKTWLKTYEPVFALNQNTNECFIEPFGELRIEPYDDMKNGNLKDPLFRVFSISDERGMLEAAAHNEMKTGHPFSIKYAPTIIDDSLAYTDSETLDLIHQSRVVCDRIATALAEGRTVAGIRLIEIAPTLLMIHWAAVRDAVRTDDSAANIDGVAGNLSQLIACVENVEKCHDTDIVSQELKHRFTEALLNWGNRMVTLQTVAAPFPQ